MKRVGIVTINDNNNYGNRLQNYALSKVIESFGCSPKNIENYPYFNSKRYYLLKRIKYRHFDYYYSKDNEKKENFRQFNQLISYYPGIYSPYKKYSDLDFVVCGSDQIWNPLYALDECTILKIFPNHKRIAFSASFGVDFINDTGAQLIKKELLKFKNISVREEAGAKIIKDLTGRDATVLVDPTMLLTKEEWRKVSKQPKRAKEGYILTYFLSPKCEEAKVKLEEIRGDKEVYELLNPEDQFAGTAGPSEFLWLFDHADLILTDSFHACVFSFLFNKPFIVYDRNWNEGNMNSRLETLLSNFSLERKYAGSGLLNDIWEHDYTEGYKQLEIERKKAINFLKKALED